MSGSEGSGNSVSRGVKSWEEGKLKQLIGGLWSV